MLFVSENFAWHCQKIVGPLSFGFSFLTTWVGFFVYKSAKNQGKTPYWNKPGTTQFYATCLAEKIHGRSFFREILAFLTKNLMWSRFFFSLNSLPKTLRGKQFAPKILLYPLAENGLCKGVSGKTLAWWSKFSKVLRIFLAGVCYFHIPHMLMFGTFQKPIERTSKKWKKNKKKEETLHTVWDLLSKKLKM